MVANKNDLIRLKDKDGIPRCPVAKSDGVFMPDGNTTLTKKIQGLDEQLETTVREVSEVSSINLTEISLTNANDYFIWWVDAFDRQYVSKNNSLYITNDNIKYELIYTFNQPIAGIRVLNENEILVSIEKNDINIKGSLWKGNIKTKTFKKVLESSSFESKFHGGWGLSVEDGVICVSEYGSLGKAIYAYISYDNAETFTSIFNLSEHIREAELLQYSHIHGIAYDKYYKRIWITHGDRFSFDNFGTFYSDDFGVTWKRAFTSSQLLNIMVFKECVVFGSDSYPNGIFGYIRNDKNKDVKVELVYKLDDHQAITYIPFTTYRKSDKDICVMSWFFMDDASLSSGGKIATASKDGLNWHKIYEDNSPHDKASPFTLFNLKGGFIGSIKGDRVNSTTLLKSNLEYVKDLPITNIKTLIDNRLSFVNAKALGLKGNGINETRELQNAIEYCAKNNIELEIPSDMVVSVGNVVVENLENIKINCLGQIKILPNLNSGTNANCVKFINCTNIFINQFNGNGNTQLGVQTLHNIISFENCSNINCGTINAYNVCGYGVRFKGCDSVVVDNINGISKDTGNGIVKFENSNSNIRIRTINAIGVGSSAVSSKGIEFENIVSDTLKNIYIGKFYNNSISLSSINMINNCIAENIKFVDVEIVDKPTKTTDGSIINIQGVRELELNCFIKSEITNSSNFKGTGLRLNNIDDFSIKLKTKNLLRGAELGNTLIVKNGVINCDIRNCKFNGLGMAKIENVEIENSYFENCGLDGRATYYNISRLEGDNIINTRFYNCIFKNSSGKVKNINMYNATANNLIFENCNMEAFAIFSDKIDSNGAGITKINNKGLNYLPSKPTLSYWNKGEVVYNTNPVVGEFIGWVCITSGLASSSVWKGFGLIEA